jgi:exopolysaccharide biosynthesis polyprenyl glycosylphosphotransferase
MNGFRRQLLLRTFVGADLLFMAISLYLGVFDRDAFRSLFKLNEVPVQLHFVIAMAILLYGWRAAFALIGLHRSRRLSSKLEEEIFDIFKASSAATLLLIAIAVLFHIRSITPHTTLRFMALSSCILIVSRLIMRPVLKAIRRRGHNLRHLVVAGTNIRAIGFANSILAQPELGYQLEGFIDSAWFGPLVNDITPTIVTDVNGFSSYLRDHIVDELVIALPLKSNYEKANYLVEVCREQGIVVRVLSDLFAISTAKMRIDHFERNTVMSIYTFPIDGMPLVAKRFLDILVSGALLVLLSPVLVLTAVFVKLDSKGTAIFAQERVGLNKRRFRMYKFRTMVVNAEKLQDQLESRNEAQGPVFKIKNDPRITRIGKFLRKTSIDELPQLFNVIRGDMSLVGPRPLPVRDYKGFDQDWQRRRFSVSPGITCLWQVSGRNGISFNQWMDLDMEYIDNWSFWLDMKILIKTVPAVVRGSGAA